MSKSKRWVRRSQSANNFDLVLAHPQELNSKRIEELLDRIQGETHRGLTLSARADKEFRRWSRQPDTPLKSEAYVLLSNWYLTQSGDRHSMVAGHCETLWDELFPCRPMKRLSSPEPGRNHVMVPEEFEAFWRMVLKAQGEDEEIGQGTIADSTRPFQLAKESAIHPATPPSESSNESRPDFTSGRPLTIAEAKAALAFTFGVSADQVEITIRG